MIHYIWSLIKKHILTTIIYFVILIINIYLANTTNPNIPFVKFMSGNVTYFQIIYFVYILSVFLIIASYIINEKENEIQAIKNRYDREVSTMSGLVEAKYGQFSNFIEYERVKDDLGVIVSQIPLIIGFTLHDYSLRLKSDNYEICMQCDISIAQEGYDINTIVKKYYNIKKKIMNMVNELVKEYENRNYERLESIEKSTNNLIEEMEKTDSNNPVYERIELIFLAKYKKLKDKSEFISINDYDHKKRTGILGTFLLQDEYFYNYNKDKDSKLGRAYMSFNLNVGGKNKIATMILNVDDYPMHYIKNEINQAYEMLKEKGYDIL